MKEYPRNRNGAGEITGNRVITPDIYRQTQADSAKIAESCNQLHAAGYDVLSVVSVPGDTQVNILAKKRSV